MREPSSSPTGSTSTCPGSRTAAVPLRELLSHSSGMQAEPPGPWWERSPGVPIEALLAELDEADAPFPAGREYHYSNLAYALLGELVARKRGASWAASLQSRLLDPLGMNRTSYLAEPPAASGYSVDPFTGTVTREPTHDAQAMAPAGQLWSTVADLARLAAFLASPDPAVLAPATVSEMTAGQTGRPDAVAAGAYGLGLQLAVAGDRSYLGHTGSVPGFLAGLFVDRARGTAGVCLANAASGVRAQGLPVQLMRLLEELEPTLARTWTPTVELPSVARDALGLWYWGNMAFTLSYHGDQLIGRFLSDRATWFTVGVVGGERLVGVTGYFAGEAMQVVRRPDGSVSHLECATFIFTRVPYDPDAPIPGG